MIKKEGQAGRARDYSDEYKKRMKKDRRLAADIDKERAEALLQRLAAKKETYSAWLIKQINNELK
jgi:hypothetical protein